MAGTTDPKKSAYRTWGPGHCYSWQDKCDALCEHGDGDRHAAGNEIQVTLALAGDAAPLNGVLLHEANGLQLLQNVADQTT